MQCSRFVSNGAFHRAGGREDGRGRRLLVTKVQIEDLVVGRYHTNSATPTAIHSQQHKTKPPVVRLSIGLLVVKVFTEEW